MKYERMWTELEKIVNEKRNTSFDCYKRHDNLKPSEKDIDIMLFAKRSFEIWCEVSLKMLEIENKERCTYLKREYGKWGKQRCGQ